MDLQTVPGRYVVKPVEGIDDWPWYWHAYLGETRVNGGLARDYVAGTQEAKRAIRLARRDGYLATHYFDCESGHWYPKGELPPVD